MKRPNKNEINIWRKIEENEEVKALFEDVLKTTQIHQTPDSRNTSNKIYTKLLNSKYTNQKTINIFAVLKENKSVNLGILYPVKIFLKSERKIKALSCK